MYAKKVVKTDKTVSYIMETYDYDRFWFFKENRPIARAHLKNIKESMENKELQTPIKVNSEYGIWEGQHSFLSRKELGLPILYYIDDNCTIDDMSTMNNVSRSWSLKDHLHHQIQKGIKDYKDFEWFIKKYNIPVSVGLVIIFGQSSLPIRDFKAGNFRFKNIEKAKTIAELLMKFDIDYAFEHYKNKNFVEAFTHCFNLKRNVFDPKKLFSKIDRSSQLLKVQATPALYIDLFERILNYGKKRKTHLPRV